MKFKQILLFSLIVPGFVIKAVDLGNFEYISAKYRPYFPGKQLSNQSQQSLENKTDWLGVHTGILAVGATVASLVPQKYQGPVQWAAIVGGASVGLMGPLIDEERSVARSRLEYERYSHEHSDLIKKYGFNQEKYKVISRYPKREIHADSPLTIRRQSGFANSFYLSVASIAWGLWGTISRSNKSAQELDERRQDERAAARLQRDRALADLRALYDERRIGS